MRVMLGMSGASGVIYGVRLLEVLSEVPNVESHLVMSPAAHQTIKLETDLDPKHVYKLADVVYKFGDITAGPSSGSFRLDAMVVLPCSMRTLASIAYSLGDNLLVRAADVALKERRPLVVAPRETPLHLGHLRAMTQLVEMGAIVAPPLPAFYHRPVTVDDIVNQTVNRVLDLIGLRLDPDLFERWSGGRAGSAGSTPDEGGDLSLLGVALGS